MTRVLSVASECAPLVKTGGLADVVGALPAALAPEGVEMRVLLPGYPAVMAAMEDGIVLTFDPLMGGVGRLLRGRVAGVELYVLDAPHLYDRGGSVYLSPEGRDWADNPERFAALCYAAAAIADGEAGDWRPDIVHAHDWQGGLVPEFLDQRGLRGRVGTVLTIHNIAFHGYAPPERAGAMWLRPEGFTPEGYEFWGQISALKAGLAMSDRLTTVSPTYAAELMTGAFGMGFEGLLRARRGDLTGILNGIDEAVWNPATDPAIAAYDTPKGKAKAKAALRVEMDLPQAEGPLCVVVSRLTEQKGLDLLLEALPVLTRRGGQLALLGSGDPGLESAFRDRAASEANVAVRIGYDEALSHRLIAGGDAILVPSRFEPCGLTQLYGLRYGTVPVVALTGGLADTIVNASPAGLAARAATGLQFHPVAREPLEAALDRLCDLFADRQMFTLLQKNAMKHPVGWQQSARAYAALYRDLLSH
ncbi:glycogen synthase GlgA [Wenxinia saemankumensis]|uniref:Glycogen synthase n=1 Tax=Wenxinia saemankumensis TaxID=1447782 RepID=A0A1M6AY62_9RHOB|nr:glycogen synthase GlgA [Wenxinia saemankumensis]SHI41405.1 starch synthase [Wenxinia saemankumensis]